MSFDYGTEGVVEPGGNFKNPAVGDHSARLRSLIHCGLFRETFKGKKKKPAPQVIAIFELKDEEDFEDDGVTPLTISKSFPLKKGDKSFMTKFIKALDPQGKAKGFDDLIGAACQINCKGSKDKNEDGTPKYINFGGLSGLPKKFADMIDPLVVEGSGHVRFDDLTKEAIMELHPIRDVAFVLTQGEQYKGSIAESIIEDIRKDNPEFGTFKSKTKEEKEEEGAKPEVETDLNEDEEF
jgi:hypothetical protein